MFSTLSGPSVAAVTSAETVLRSQLSLEPDENENDAQIDALCLTAIGLVEHRANCRLITQDLRMTMNGFGKRAIDLPIGPLQEVVAVRHVDASGNQQVLDSAAYRIVRSGGLPRLAPPYGQLWPTTLCDFDSVEIDLRVGFGDAPADIPAPLLQAVRVLVAHLFLNAEAVAAGAMSEMPLSLSDMIASQRVFA